MIISFSIMQLLVVLYIVFKLLYLSSYIAITMHFNQTTYYRENTTMQFNQTTYYHENTAMQFNQTTYYRENTIFKLRLTIYMEPIAKNSLQFPSSTNLSTFYSRSFNWAEKYNWLLM